MCNASVAKLTAAHIGLLAAQGIGHIDVFARPKIGIFSTGDELRAPPQKLGHGDIFCLLYTSPSPRD